MQTVTRDQLNAAADTFFRSLVRQVDQPRDFHPDHWDDDVAENIELSEQDTLNHLRCGRD